MAPDTQMSLAQPLMELAVYPLVRINTRDWRIEACNDALRLWLRDSPRLPMPGEALFADATFHSLCLASPPQRWENGWRHTTVHHGAFTEPVSLDIRAVCSDPEDHSAILALRPQENWLLHFPNIACMYSAVTSFPALILFHDTTERVHVYADNLRHSSPLGKPPERMQALEDYLPYRLLTQVRHLDEKARQSGERVEADLFFPGEEQEQSVWLKTFREVVVGPDGQDLGVMTLATDATDVHLFEGQLGRRDRLLHATANVAGQLLGDVSNPAQTFHSALGTLGRAAGVDRVHLWHMFTEEENPKQMSASQLHEWAAPGVAAYQDNADTARVVLSENMERWMELFNAGGCVNAVVEDLPEPERSILRKHQVLSMLLAPVVLRGKVWGFIGFDDCTRMRVWSRSEENILHTAGALLGAVLDNLRMYRKLEQSNAELSRLLATASRLAEETQAAHVAKNEFLANISHELRTPLNAILGLTKLALHQGLPPDLTDRLQKIDNAGRSLSRLIDNMLDVATLSNGSLTLQDRLFSPGGLLRSVREHFRPMAEKKGLDLSVECADDLPPAVLGDPGRLRQVLDCLIDNAIKFTDSGSVRILARCKAGTPGSLAPNETLLCFSVKDDGIGVSPDMVEHIFLPFSQEDGSATRRHGGAGIGLALASRLVSLMHGAIECASFPGKGATFFFTARFTLPGPKPDPLHPKTDRDAILNTLPSDGLVDFSGKRALLVEDNAINQIIAKEMLEGAGFSVHVAGDGLEALDALELEGFDIVLMDIQMPRMDGLTATRLIRNTPRFAQLPILAVSANSSPADKAQSLLAGMNGHIAKPIMPESLFAALETLLNPSPSEAAPPHASVTADHPTSRLTQRVE